MGKKKDTPIDEDSPGLEEETPGSGEKEMAQFDIAPEREARRGWNREEEAPVNKGVAEAIRRAGGQRALAKDLSVSQPTVNAWLYENCPAERAVQIETRTGVARHLIRPDLFSISPPEVKTSSKYSERYERYEP